MKKKTYTFEQGMKEKNAIYTQEIKSILINNSQIETVAGYDEMGNYTITLMIPDWKDKWKFNSANQINSTRKEVAMKPYGNYQQAKGYKNWNSR